MIDGQGWSLFETTIGVSAICWGPGGILGLLLPEASAAAMQARLARRFAPAGEARPPQAVRRAIDAIRALLEGERIDLSGVQLDMAAVPPFNRRVYAVARQIPAGETMTYGEVAARIGEAGAARAVGRALGLNPFPIVVPCHRVLAAGGRIGGFSAQGGAATKARMLAIERARIGPPSLFEGEISLRPPAASARG